LVIKKTELFSEDHSQVVEMATVADPQQAGNLWRNVRDASFATYLNLQPGSSDHLAVEHELFDRTKHTSTFMILNLDSGEILCQISNSVDLLPTSWWGGAFLFLRNRKACGSNDDVKLQVVTCDFSQRISFGTAEDLEKEATCLLSGPMIEFSGAPQFCFGRYSYPRQHVDYSGVVVYEDMPGKLFFAAIN
jgi:hypothetical protein